MFEGFALEPEEPLKLSWNEEVFCVVSISILDINYIILHFESHF